MISSRLVLVRGTGDVASAVAHALFKAGHRVLCHDISAPAYSRRGMAFTDAIFRGLATLEGVLARRAPSLEALQHMLGCCNAISVTTEKFPVVLDWVRPTVVVDARMRKRTVPEIGVKRALEDVAPFRDGFLDRARMINAARRVAVDKQDDVTPRHKTFRRAPRTNTERRSTDAVLARLRSSPKAC